MSNTNGMTASINTLLQMHLHKVPAVGQKVPELFASAFREAPHIESYLPVRFANGAVVNTLGAKCDGCGTLSTEPAHFRGIVAAQEDQLTVRGYIFCAVCKGVTRTHVMINDKIEMFDLSDSDPIN